MRPQRAEPCPAAPPPTRRDPSAQAARVQDGWGCRAVRPCREVAAAGRLGTRWALTPLSAEMRTGPDGHFLRSCTACWRGSIPTTASRSGTAAAHSHSPAVCCFLCAGGASALGPCLTSPHPRKSALFTKPPVLMSPPPCSSHCLRAAAFYVRGLFSFFQGRYNEAK